MTALFLLLACLLSSILCNLKSWCHCINAKHTVLCQKSALQKQSIVGPKYNRMEASLSQALKASIYLVEHVKKAHTDLSTNENNDDPFQKVRLLILHELQQVLHILRDQMQLQIQHQIGTATNWKPGQLLLHDGLKYIVSNIKDCICICNASGSKNLQILGCLGEALLSALKKLCHFKLLALVICLQVK